MVITESMLRKRKSELLKTKVYYALEGAILTPSAKGFLLEQKIQLWIGEKCVFPHLHQGEDMNKPEHMTHLRGKQLVSKCDKIICFRGKMDSLQGKILETQYELSINSNDNEKIVKALEEVLVFVRKLLRCEVLEEEVGEINILGYGENEMHECSHNPMKYYGIPHLQMTYRDGFAVLRLNVLRTLVREAELVAIEAFTTDRNSQPSRKDIIRGLNRLSSLFYVMMLENARKIGV